MRHFKRASLTSRNSSKSETSRKFVKIGRPMATPPDPFDVQALEGSINDSATRVSTIWVGFLLFGLYITVAAGATTDRQLLLEEPIKLPILDVNLSVFSFYFLAPLMFVVYHVYLLVQVVLLARTADVYEEAIERTTFVSADRAR